MTNDEYNDYANWVSFFTNLVVFFSTRVVQAIIDDLQQELKSRGVTP